MKRDIYVRKKNFNSHAHVERDDRYDEAKKRVEISTHTLTWSVTQRCNFKNFIC